MVMDLFLVLFLYAVMLGAGPAIAFLMGRRAMYMLTERRTALEDALAQDPAVLVSAREDGGIAFTAVQDGVELHVDEVELVTAVKAMRAHAHDVWLGRRTTLYVGIPASARRSLGDRVTPLGQQLFGSRMEVRARDVVLAETLLQNTEVKEAILDVFRAPLFGLAVELSQDATLTLDVRLDYDPETIGLLRQRARRLVEVLRQHANIEVERPLPEGATRGALAGPSGAAIGVAPFRGERSSP